MVETPDLFYLIAQEVLDCACEALTGQDASCPCPCRKFVTVGQPVWDQCCDGGQLAVFMERVYVASTFPAANNTAITCAAPLIGEFTLQLIRCVPTMDDQGHPPTPDDLTASAQAIYSDMYITFRAVLCCLAAYRKYRNFTMRDGRFVGPQGGCAGFEIKFAVELTDPIPVI